MAVSAELVKSLREKTQAGVMECKKALEETNGNFEKAEEYLRRQGLAKAEKRRDRETSEGRVGSYIHTTGKLGAIVEVNCETDFVARTDEFQQFVRDLCMQVAATNPLAIRREDIPQDVIEKEKEAYKEGIKDKPPHIIEKIVEGKLDKFFQEKCLLDQPFIRDDGITVKELLDSKIAKLGENITIRRFARLEIGQE